MATFPHLYLTIEVSRETKIAKRNKGLCVAYRCQRMTVGNKVHCNTCRSRLSRLRSPLNYAFNMVKESARKRGIGFELTLAEFKTFCDATGYLEKKGNTPGSMTVDRKRSNEPYTADNIRPMEWLANSSHTHEADPDFDPSAPFG